MDRCDLLVVGAGVVGLAAAREYARAHPRAKVVVLDKEGAVGRHASGRNSGVLHAGFYYAADSLKARFSVEGNRELGQLCDRAGLPIRRCGKLVVARTERELPGLDALVARGVANGVRIERLSAEDARRIEPSVAGVGAAWSPDTAVVDPERVVAQLAAEAQDAGVELRLGAPFTGRSGGIVTTPSGPIGAGVVLNCAGAYADRVAAAWGVGARFALVPFRGSYVLGDGAAPRLACCVYPVPDPELPFLGVHLTVRVDGGVKIGPTAGPARWREDYGGAFGLDGFRVDELGEQVAVQTRLLTTSTFRRHALRELGKHSRTVLVAEARKLVGGLRRGSFRTWGRTGIRAQLVDRATGGLVSDFVVEAGDRSVHVLNAVSPAFTCALPFARYLASRVEALA